LLTESSTNHLPEIKGDDYAMWRRIRLIPFNRIFKEDERDERLGQRFDETELPGILGWCAENDQKPNSQKWLGPRIQRKGCEKQL